MSASGLASTTLVAIDQILRLAPSSNPPIDPVVSSTKATSTVGLAMACESAAPSGRLTAASTNAQTPCLNPLVMRDVIIPLR